MTLKFANEGNFNSRADYVHIRLRRMHYSYRRTELGKLEIR